MKSKLLTMAAIAAMLMACNKNESVEAPIDNHFKKGQEVTLTLGAKENSQKAPARITGVAGWSSSVTGEKGDGNVDMVKYSWEDGDKINVSVKGGSSSEFTLSKRWASGEDNKKTDMASFTGFMPAEGDVFDITYGPESVPVEQPWSNEDWVGSNLMRFEAHDCQLSDGTFQMYPQWGVLRILFGAGTNYNYDIPGYDEGLKSKEEAVIKKNVSYECTLVEMTDLDNNLLHKITFKEAESLSQVIKAVFVIAPAEVAAGFKIKVHVHPMIDLAAVLAHPDCSAIKDVNCVEDWVNEVTLSADKYSIEAGEGLNMESFTASPQWNVVH